MFITVLIIISAFFIFFIPSLITLAMDHNGGYSQSSYNLLWLMFVIAFVMLALFATLLMGII
ncbi:hypothetical protein KC799_16905 [candidate division KSB1 bacterium]|nr:hypothetical protein [candidate division KSB1 bacterium]